MRKISLFDFSLNLRQISLENYKTFTEAIKAYSLSILQTIPNNNTPLDNIMQYAKTKAYFLHSLAEKLDIIYRNKKLATYIAKKPPVNTQRNPTE